MRTFAGLPSIIMDTFAIISEGYGERMAQVTIVIIIPLKFIILSPLSSSCHHYHLIMVTR